MDDSGQRPAANVCTYTRINSNEYSTDTYTVIHTSTTIKVQLVQITKLKI